MIENHVSSDPSRDRIIVNVEEHEHGRVFSFGGLAVTFLPAQAFVGRTPALAHVFWRGSRVDRGVIARHEESGHTIIFGLAHHNLGPDVRPLGPRGAYVFAGFDADRFAVSERVCFNTDCGFQQRLRECWERWLWSDSRSPLADRINEACAEYLKPASIAGADCPEWDTVVRKMEPYIRAQPMPAFMDLRSIAVH